MHDVLACDLAEIPLHIHSHCSFGGECLDGVKVEIVSKECAEVIYVGVDIAEVLGGERVCLGKHTLGAVVHVFTVFVFKIYGFAAWNHLDIDSFGTEFLHNPHL